jgi:predicted metal-dependent HD superfamily phosphohydrolase
MMDATQLLVAPADSREARDNPFSRFSSEFEEIAPLFRTSTLDVLIDAYNEPGRQYHTRWHIASLLRVFARLRDLADDPVAVKAAIFFHDAIYHIPLDPQYPPPHDNEERSIKLMHMMARDDQHPSLVKAVKLVRATTNHYANKDIDVRLIHDLDLSILATSRHRYARFERELRAEYEVYPYPLWATARLTQLRSFMERRRIYALPPLFLAWEERARANLAWAISELAKGRTPGS